MEVYKILTSINDQLIEILSQAIDANIVKDLVSSYEKMKMSSLKETMKKYNQNQGNL